MEYIQKVKPKPYKIVPIFVPNEYEFLSDGNIKVTETIKKEIYLTKEEVKKVIISINDKINFHKFEISKGRLEAVNKDIKNLTKLKDSWEQAIKDKL